MRVLMISDVYFPRINGVSTSIETFRADLAAEGIGVRLIAPAYPGHHRHKNEAAIWRIPSRRVPFDPEDRLMHWRALERTAHGLASEGIDLIHVQTPFAAHYAGTRAARRHRVPVVATYHTHFEEYIGHYLPALPRTLLKAGARRIAASQCNDLDAVIVPSHAMHQTLGGYGVKAPLHVLPTGIPLRHFGQGDGRRFRAAHAIAPERPLALFVGRVAHEKNIGFLIEALATAVKCSPDVLLVIAGEGPARLALQRQARESGLAGNIRFVGYLDRDGELTDCYAAADVFVFASRTETQGLVLLEAMAAGLPVYAQAEMGTRDILGAQRGAIIAPDDAVEFGMGLASLLGNRYQLDTLAADARDYAREWAAPARARQLAGLYRSLATANA
ncbi:MAG: glycosyltransferase [Gammaproteobacteria bacterium]|nr:glycosyltransferase [Gammaproteobacteria bacterium]MBU1647207.1 glycosyltransferase [Gammaproteobacteria bacterium]MBU1972719.1 glycosyltransferase [Gammaproteobacteria bacterium]